MQREKSNMQSEKKTCKQLGIATEIVNGPFYQKKKTTELA